MSKEVRQSGTQYDLLERTAKFSEDLIDFLKIIPLTDITRPLIGQLLRSGTSIGANYMEADGAESKKDFKHKVSIARKEAKETMYWLRLLAKTSLSHKAQCRAFYKEAQEFVFIFSTMIKKISS